MYQDGGVGEGYGNKCYFYVSCALGEKFSSTALCLSLTTETEMYPSQNLKLISENILWRLYKESLKGALIV
jgi:hypothetical protein